MMQSAREAAIDAVRDPGVGHKLPAVCVAGELQTEGGLLHDGQARGRMVQQDSGLGTLRFRIV